MDMKLRGMYIARQLSFHGVTFKIDEVPISDSFQKAYDDSVALVISLQILQKIEFYVHSIKSLLIFISVLSISSGLRRCKSLLRPPS